MPLDKLEFEQFVRAVNPPPVDFGDGLLQLSHPVSLAPVGVDAEQAPCLGAVHSDGQRHEVLDDGAPLYCESSRATYSINDSAVTFRQVMIESRVVSRS